MERSRGGVCRYSRPFPSAVMWVFPFGTIGESMSLKMKSPPPSLPLSRPHPFWPQSLNARRELRSPT